MNPAICEHIKIGGERCGSPARRGLKYCHHHAGVHWLVPKTNLLLNMTYPAAELDPLYPNQLPYLEDIGYMQFMRTVVDNRIDVRRAKLLLEGLRSASANVRHSERLKAKAAELALRYKKPPARVNDEAADSCGWPPAAKTAQ